MLNVCGQSSSRDVWQVFLRSALTRIANTDISDSPWLQASLPIKAEGLGIRQVRSLALLAYLASAASTSDLQSQVLSVTFCATDIDFDTYLTTWQTTFGSLPASDPLPCKQSFWDRPGILASRAVVESSISDPVQRATFLAASAPHSVDWLLALPISSCGMKLNDDAVSVAVSLRLGCSICVAHTCRCGVTVDVQGQHGLICNQAGPQQNSQA